MEFSVTFSTGSRSHAVELPDRQVGLNMVDRVRSELALPELDIGRILPTVYGMSADPRIEISEATARETGLFRENNNVEVITSTGKLNGYVRYVVQPYREEGTGEVIKVVVWTELDEDCTVAAWLEDGAPLEWGNKDGDGDGASGEI